LSNADKEQKRCSFLAHLSIPDHDTAISRAGVYETVPTPLDTSHRSGVARQCEEAAARVGIPHFCSAILGSCYKAPAGHLNMSRFPRYGHDHFGMTCTVTGLQKGFGGGLEMCHVTLPTKKTCSNQAVAFMHFCSSSF